MVRVWAEENKVNTRKRRELIWKMIRKYQMPEGYAVLALILLEVNGLLSAARYCWHYRETKR